MRTIGFKSLADLTEEEKKVLLWRGGRKECVIDADKLNICYHHHSKLGTIFEKRFTKCCNLFKTHKRNVKGGHKISLQLATKLDDHGYECIVGHAMILHKEFKRMLEMKRHNLSMNNRKLINWILRQPIIQQAILIPTKQGNNQEIA